MNLKKISGIICVLLLTATIAISSVSAVDKNPTYNVNVGETITVPAPSSYKYGGITYSLRYNLKDVSPYASIKSGNNEYYVTGLQKTNNQIKLFDVEVKYLGKWHTEGAGWINVI
ncbi:MAG: hypothetical protein LBT10_06655 [Methanobrevibacter sp.]|jgi:hypothetical protein|nr:hypothetical protein [Methanobrevibacter sp.]